MHDRLFRQTIDAVTEAADHALTLWAGGKTLVQRWEKTPGEIVCDADMDVNAMLKSALFDLAPDAGWLSEETADSAHRLGTDRVWV
ncbi:MAG: 3'(2'),5'-bisphosphate nucleotidase CysQ, partial [Sphingobium sp.]